MYERKRKREREDETELFGSNSNHVPVGEQTTGSFKFLIQQKLHLFESLLDVFAEWAKIFGHFLVQLLQLMSNFVQVIN